MPNLYTSQMKVDDDVYYYRPHIVQLPVESHKYITITFDSTLFKLSNLVYGTKDLYYLILAANNRISYTEFKHGEQIRVLLNDFLNEVK